MAKQRVLTLLLASLLIALCAGQLSQSTHGPIAARYQPASAGSGARAAIAGGSNSTNAPSKVIDVFDCNSGVWNTTSLAEARSFLTGTAAGNKFIFAGGLNSSG
jgi:hypothetical protein